MTMHVTVDTLLDRVKALRPCPVRTLQRQKHQAEDAAVAAEVFNGLRWIVRVGAA